MPEDNFRPRVQPSDRPGPAEPWPDLGEPPAETAAAGSAATAHGEQPSTNDSDDLLGPFDVIRRALDARRAADQALTLGHAIDDASIMTFDTAPAYSVPVVAPVAEATPTRARFAPAAPVAPPVLPKPARPAEHAKPAPASTAATPANPSHRTRGRLIAGVGILAALAIGAGVATAVATHTQNSAKAPAAPSASATPLPNVLQAVAWVNTSVGPTHVVACDASVCALLREHGFPASSLVVVSGLADVEQADIVILTSALRGQLGTPANAIVAPEPLAVFGFGSVRVEVAAVALDGTASYTQSMTADRQSRRTEGTALLGNSHLVLTPEAQVLLGDGLVDSRVCALLALLSGSHTIVLAGFTPLPPGAGPDVPSTGVVIESIDGQPATGSSSAAAELLSTVKAQQDPYLAMSTAPGALGGHQGLRIVFSQPGPLDLLASATS